MKCPQCEGAMMALWHDLEPDHKMRFLVPIFDCAHCGAVASVLNCEDMVAWIQASILGEGGVITFTADSEGD